MTLNTPAQPSPLAGGGSGWQLVKCWKHPDPDRHREVQALVEAARKRIDHDHSITQRYCDGLLNRAIIDASTRKRGTTHRTRHKAA